MGTASTKEEEEAAKQRKEKEEKKAKQIKEKAKQIIQKEIDNGSTKNAQETLKLLWQSQKPQKPAKQKAGHIDFDSRPIRENHGLHEKVLKKIIPGQDGRKQIHNTLDWPHCVHGVLTMIFDGKVYTGTATMIGPNLAITAAHNLYHIDTNTEVNISDLCFYPAVNGSLFPFGSIKVKAFYYPEQYKYTQEGEDYALLVLSRDIGYETGYFGLKFLEKSELEKMFLEQPGMKTPNKINIFGYPADKVSEKPKCHEMWGMDGGISHLNDNYMEYLLDTFSGQSGSAIWYEEEDTGNYYIIGVHVAGHSLCNKGTYLNNARLETIQSWITSFYSDPIHQEGNIKNLKFDLECSDQAAIELVTQIVQIKSLQSLQLEFSWGSYLTDRGVTELATQIGQNLRSVRHLSLDFRCDSHITDQGVKELASQIGQNLRGLVHFQLTLPKCVNVSDEGIKELALQIGKLNRLEYLSLCIYGFENITDQGVKELATQIGKNLMSLQRLVLNFPHCINIADEGIKELAIQICQKLKKHLQHLEFSFYDCKKMTDEGVKELALQIGQNLKSLQYLDLNFDSCKLLTDESVGKLGLWFGQNLNSLHHLKLDFGYCTKIKYEGMKELAAQIGQNLKDLKSLFLSFAGNANITDDDFMKLGTELRNNLSQKHFSSENISAEFKILRFSI